jgi:hypothetical protein
MEIEPNRLQIEVTDGHYGVLHFNADDIVMRHGPQQYDHVRGHWIEGEDEEEQVIIKLAFYPQSSLDRIEGMGIPTAYLDTPTKSTIRAYEADQISRWDDEYDWSEDEEE